MQNHADVIVIGAGPAGMMAAGHAAALGASVMLIEKMSQPGRKLLMTGNGRCNLTCDRDAKRFLRDCGSSGPFLRKAVGRFDPGQTREFFEARGLSLMTEPDGRCFPASGRAADVLAALKAFVDEAGVRFICGAVVEALTVGPSGFNVDTSQGRFEAKTVVIATGGSSYPVTGSTGDGFRLAKSLGHRIVAPRPAEVPLVVADPWISELAGVSLADVGVCCIQGDRHVDFRGAVLFTHNGLSGPAVLDASRVIARWHDNGSVALGLDLLPGLSEADVDAGLAQEIAGHGKRSIPAIIRAFLPERVARRVAIQANSLDEIPSARLPAVARRALAARIKNFVLTVIGTRGFKEAVVTSGGVVTSEVDPTTLESLIVPGLHFAGEVLDVDGPRGGYNLQIAWATGWAAGGHAAGGGSKA